MVGLENYGPSNEKREATSNDGRNPAAPTLDLKMRHVKTEANVAAGDMSTRTQVNLRDS